MSPSIDMTALAVVLDQPETLEVRRLALTPPASADCVVDVDFSGISTGTERLLWSGRMPPFPGMGYPLVPGYESVGKVVWAGDHSGREVGEQVFVPGARCYGDVNGLFGGAASRVVIPGARLLSVPAALQAEGRDDQAVLLALAATAYHAVHAPDGRLPELIIGHGVLGRLLARVAVAASAAPVVWETNPQRADGAEGYEVVDPKTDDRQDYGSIYDVSGDGTLLDKLIGRLAHGGEIVLAGFYEAPLSFNFPPAFMREMRLRVAAEFREPDLAAVRELIEAGRLSLDGLITHRREVVEAADAYVTAFNDPTCLKMVLDWRGANA